MQPDRALYWTMWHHHHRITVYDNAAWRSMADLVSSATRAPRRLVYANERVYDINERRPTGWDDIR